MAPEGSAPGAAPGSAPGSSPGSAPGPDPPQDPPQDPPLGTQKVLLLCGYYAVTDREIGKQSGFWTATLYPQSDDGDDDDDTFRTGEGLVLPL